jgi:quercetin dioxygenase-like cupin family protein
MWTGQSDGGEDMRISGKSHSSPSKTPDGQRAFYGLFDRLEAADGDVSFVLQVNEPGQGTEAGAHDWEQWLFVHKGRVRFFVGDQEILADSGDLLYVPRNVTHRHEWVGDESVELLVVNHWPHDTDG